MDSKNEITHTGIIKSVSNNNIIVSIIVQAGCVSCQMKKACTMSDQAEKEIQIQCNTSQYRVGQKVLVKLKTKQGMNAMFLGYVLPFLVLLFTMLITSSITNNEATIGLISLASAAIYFLILYFFKERIKKKFSYVVLPLK